MWYSLKRTTFGLGWRWRLHARGQQVLEGHALTKWGARRAALRVARRIQRKSGTAIEAERKRREIPQPAFSPSDQPAV